VDRIYNESIWLRSPDFADVFVRCEAIERFKAACVIVGIKELDEICAQLVMVLVVVPFDSCVLDRAVHALDLILLPRMIWLGQAMLNAICSIDHVEPHGPGTGGVPVAGLLTELDAIVR
jgi:hypothetical protein